MAEYPVRDASGNVIVERPTDIAFSKRPVNPGAFGFPVRDGLGNALVGLPGVADPAPLPKFDFPNIALAYYDSAVPYSVGITMRGTRGITYVEAGTGNPIVADERGLTFSAGIYLQANPSGSQAYERMVLLVEATVNAAVANNVMQVDQDTTQRMILRTTGNGDLQGQGPGNVSTNIGGRVVEIGARQFFAFIYDRTGATTGGTDKMGVIGDDGFMTVTANANTFDNIVLNNMRIGQGVQVTLHRMALIGALAGESFPASVLDLWRGFAQRDVTPADATKAWVMAATGHSLNACRPLETGFPSSLWTCQDRRGTKMLGSMLNTTAQAVQLEGPLWGQINQSVPATIQPAEVNGNITVMSAASVALHKWRPANMPEHLVICTAAGGAQAGDLASSPPTGFIHANATFMASEAARLLAGRTVERVVSSICIGTSDRADAAGVYATELATALTQHTNLLTAAFPTATLTEIVFQSPGRMDTTVDPWERVIMAEYDLAIARGALLVPLYPYAATGLNEHPDAIAGTLYGETAAWAIMEVMAGRRWTIAKPVITRDGGTFTLNYASLNDDEEVTFLPESYYDVAPANRGFDVVGGGAITDVSAAGKIITIKTTGTVTALRHANQRQNVVGQRHFGFRSLAVTSRSRASAVFPSRQLRRHLPAFEIAVS